MRQSDITGQKFSRLTVLKFVKSERKNKWLCRCQCGKEVLLTGDRLRSGHTKSCGCYKVDKFREMTTKHGLSAKHRKIYHAWHDMIGRCYNPKLINYKSYGGRGIKVCSEWRNSLESFVQWSLNNGFMDGLTIDRIDNEGNYEPSNCRWISHKKQCSNRSTNVFIEHNGIRETITQAGKRYGITPQSIKYRLKKGWSIQRALETPKKN